MHLKYLNHLTRYLHSVVEGQLALPAAGWLLDFRSELERPDITVHDLLHLDVFMAPQQYKTPQEPVFNDDDEAIESGEEEEQEEIQPAPGEVNDRRYIKYIQDSYPGLCFFGMKAGSDDNDTSSCAMPAFLALALPLLT